MNEKRIKWIKIGKFIGKDGKPGQDGSPDTGENIIDKINSTKRKKIDASRIKGLAKSVTTVTQGLIGDITSIIAGDGLTGGGDSGDITLGLDTDYTDDRYVNIIGDTMTGQLNIEVPTATQSALVLQTTDDDTTNNVLEALNSVGGELARITAEGYLRIGVNTPSGDDTAINISREFADSVNSHAYRDESSLSMTAASTGYASFDAQYTVDSDESFDHFSGFQSRPIFSGGGTITKQPNFWSLPQHIGAGTITWGRHFYASDYTGGGTVTNQAALYVDNLTGAGTNYAIYSAGANVESFHAGDFWINSNLRVDGEINCESLAMGIGSATSAEKLLVSVNTDGTLSQAINTLYTSSGTGNANVLQFIGTIRNNGDTSNNSVFYAINGSVSVDATADDSFMRYMSGGYFRVGYNANSGYTASSIGAYGLNIEIPSITGSGTVSLGELAGINIANQGTTKAPNNYGLRIKDQTGGTNNYAIYTNAGLNQLGDQLKIDGSQDITQLIVQANSAQTVNRLELQDSSGTANTYFDYKGNLTITPTGVGTNPLINTSGYTSNSIGVSLSPTINRTGTSYGIYSEQGFDPTGATSSFNGYLSITRLKDSSENVTTLRGFWIAPRTSASYTGTLTTSQGLFIEQSASGFAGSVPVTSYGIYIDSQNSASGNSYSLYTREGLVEFGDELITRAGRIVNTTTVNAVTYDLLESDDVLLVTYTSTGAVTSLTLPTAQTVDGRRITVKDAGGNATTNSITIDTEGTAKIEGQDTLVLNLDYESVTLICDGTNFFII